jgi:hypothetical protein
LIPERFAKVPIDETSGSSLCCEVRQIISKLQRRLRKRAEVKSKHRRRGHPRAAAAGATC